MSDGVYDGDPQGPKNRREKDLEISRLQETIKLQRLEYATLQSRVSDLESVIRSAQQEMQNFKHIYPDGFPDGWDMQPEHLASQIISLCNRQRTNFQDVLNLIAAMNDAGNEELAIIESGNKAALRWYQLARARTSENDRLTALLREAAKHAHPDLVERIEEEVGD